MANKKKSKGLGDTVAKVTKATGIDKVVKAIAGDDCGCDERKELLNKWFPYKKVECLTDNDYEYLGNLFEQKKSTISISEQRDLMGIYLRVFNEKLQDTSCASCWRDYVNNLKQVYLETQKDKIASIEVTLEVDKEIE